MYKDPEKQKFYQKAYREKHREKMKAYHKERYKKIKCGKAVKHEL